MPEALDRVFSPAAAFDQPQTMWLAVGVGLVLAFAPVLMMRASRELRSELFARWSTWCVIAAVVVGAVLLGAGPTILVVLAVSLACYQEFARSTGLFREPAVSVIVVLSAFTCALAAIDNWFALFTAVPATAAVAIAVAGLARDEPDGYLQRTALGVLAVVMVIVAPAYISMFTIDERSRTILLMLFCAVAIGDVAAFCFGKLIGGPKLAPRTSPNKTLAGSAGSLVVTTAFVSLVAASIFAGTNLARPLPLVGLGLAIALAGQLGDLVLSAVKRDIGVKDFGTALPGHGGFLDRFDSLLLVAPVAFYWIAYFDRVGAGSATRIFTGS